MQKIGTLPNGDILIKKIDGDFLREVFKPLIHSRLAFLDVETTGLDPKKYEVIQLSIIVIEEGELEGFTFFEDIFIPEEITELTGITQDMVKEKTIAWDLIEKLLVDSKYIFAHNASFDKSFVMKHLPDLKTEWICTKNNIQWRKAGHKSTSLVNLCKDHGFCYDAHNATNDVVAMLLLMGLSPDSTKLNDAFEPKSVKYACIAMKNFREEEEKVYVKLFAKCKFDDKELIKAAGFRWHPETKSWWKTVEEKNYVSETWVIQPFSWGFRKEEV